MRWGDTDGDRERERWGESGERCDTPHEDTPGWVSHTDELSGDEAKMPGIDLHCIKTNGRTPNPFPTYAISALQSQ